MQDTALFLGPRILLLAEKVCIFGKILVDTKNMHNYIFSAVLFTCEI